MTRLEWWVIAAVMIAATILMWVLTPNVAEAQGGGVQCQERATYVAKLESQYGESQMAYGTEHRAGLMELWANREKGTWTMFLTFPNGLACLVGHGDGFETFAVASKQGLPL